MAATQLKRNLAHVARDRGYRFRDRDPVLVRVTEIITNSGVSLKALEVKSGVCAATVAKWLNGTTRRPQNATIDMVLRHLGWRRDFVRSLP